MSQKDSDPLVGSLVAERFRIIRRIGGGSFGEIYMGIGPSLTEVFVSFSHHFCHCIYLIVMHFLSVICRWPQNLNVKDISVLNCDMSTKYTAN